MYIFTFFTIFAVALLGNSDGNENKLYFMFADLVDVSELTSLVGFEVVNKGKGVAYGYDRIYVCRKPPQPEFLKEVNSISQTNDKERGVGGILVQVPDGKVDEFENKFTDYLDMEKQNISITMLDGKKTVVEAIVFLSKKITCPGGGEPPIYKEDLRLVYCTEEAAGIPREYRLTSGKLPTKIVESDSSNIEDCSLV